jgi:hypothetical protein
MEDFLNKTVEHMLGRIGGPMWIRLVIQPLVSIALGLRAGARDARNGRPPFGWSWWSGHVHRGALWQEVWKDIARLFTFAAVIDVIYQVSFLREFHPLQALLVASVLAIVPYMLVRGPVNRLMRFKKRTVSHARKIA